jgi:hypothetical protein
MGATPMDSEQWTVDSESEKQRCRDAEMQRCRDAEMQRCRDAAKQ